MTCYECNLKNSRVGKITLKNFYDYKMRFNKLTKEFEISDKEGHIWGAGKTTKGAVISACNCGIRLKDIDISAGYVPLQEVIQAIKD